MIYLTSDLHLNHNKPFIYEKRGFKTIKEMNEAILTRWNDIVSEDDIVYNLGDVFLGEDIEDSLNIIKQLKGKIYYAYGNHCTDKRIAALKTLPNTMDVQMGYRKKAGKKEVILTHYPTLTANVPPDRVWSFHGHTHQNTNFVDSLPLCYHVGVDSHNCTPIAWEDAIKEMREKQNEIIQRNQKG
jgi:calcineurin-like phosphoesterase family protein